ncbi:MAG: hypothetical protein V4721_06725 [Bacteroidota bacterium]
MIISSDFGKRQKIERLKNKKGFYSFLALDHQLSLGRIPEIDSYQEWTKFSNGVDISGIVLNKGALREILQNYKKSLILQTIGGPSKESTSSKVLIATIEEAIKLDAACVSIQINFEESDYLRQIELCVLQIEKANFWGMPVLCMINLSNPTSFCTELFVKYIKFCSELGVDFIKIALPSDINKNDHEIKRYISLCPPLLFAGGDKKETILDEIRLSKDVGFCGFCIGRNIFKSQNPKETVNQINQIFVNE